MEVALQTGSYEWSGVIKNDDGSYSPGYKLLTLRTLLDAAGIMTGVAGAAIQEHDLTVSRPLLETSPVLSDDTAPKTVCNLPTFCLLTVASHSTVRQGCAARRQSFHHSQADPLGDSIQRCWISRHR